MKLLKARRVVAVLGLAAAAGLPGCQHRPPERRLRVSNRAYTVDRLFTDENGSTVYRFYDQGGFHYYIVGPRRGPQMIEPKPQNEGSDGEVPEPS